MQQRPIEILQVEDNPGDVELTREAMKEWQVTPKLHVVCDGVEALSFVRREGKYSNAPRPDLILLDLNLPKKDGRQVIAELKADPLLKTIPVIVMSTSDADTDITMAYRLGANSYVIKPIGIDSFISTLKGIGDFWLTIARLPSHEPTPEIPQQASMQ